MSTVPPPPPGRAPDPPPPPPPGAGYPGTGWQGHGSDRVVYEYGAPPPGRLPRAGFGSRAAAFLVDSILVLALPVAAVLVLQLGPTEIQTCEITEEGNVAVFGQEGVATGLCEVPTTGSFAVAGTLGIVGVLAWFAYVAWEGRTTQSVGKRLLGLRTVDARTGAAIGAGRNIGRNLLRGLMAAFFFVPFVLDHLWPLWDRDGQSLHDKATSAAVVPVERA